MQQENKIIKINKQNSHLLESFLSTAGNSLTTFRYYKHRTISIIENHICTYLILEQETPVAYGHLDKEADIVWLGIAVSEYAQGKGYGKKMMHALIDAAKEFGIENIQLSVDAENKTAITLYKKFGFVFQKENNQIQFYQKSIS